MISWPLSFFCLLLGIQLLAQDLLGFIEGPQIGKQRKALQQVISVLREIEETLMVGLVPTVNRWESLKELAQPWGNLASESLKELRVSGGSLLPTLRRLRTLAEDHSAAMIDAKARTSQAFTQAGACGILVPLLGGALYLLLPALANHYRQWLVACGVALALTGAAAIWLLHIAEIARWGGMPVAYRSWILSSQCAGERFLALIRGGIPADLAWTKACDLAALDSPDLARAWGYSIWENPKFECTTPAEESIVNAGTAIRKAVQISLMEGRPCTERVESALLALSQNIKSHTEKELLLLGTKALKPLFIFVAPALMGLLAFGLWLTASELANGVLDVF